MKKDPPIGLSIVVPIFNEEESLPRLHASIRNACEEVKQNYEIIFIDDGSRDRSFTTLEALHQEDPHVKVIRFRKNYGQTAAMAAGFRAARGDVVVSMDGDLQNDPADIPRLLAKIDAGFDVVCGWRKDRKDKLVSRKIPSRIANWIIGKITRVPIHDNGCSLKAYRKKIIKQVSLYAELHRFIPAMSSLAGARIAEIVVTHHARQFGASKYGISRVWKVFSDLFLIKLLTGFASRPSLWFGVGALFAFLLGVGSLAGGMSAGVFHITFPTVALLFFSLAGHLLVMGIVGEVIVDAGNYRPAKMIVAQD